MKRAATVHFRYSQSPEMEGLRIVGEAVVAQVRCPERLHDHPGEVPKAGNRPTCIASKALATLDQASPTRIDLPAVHEPVRQFPGPATTASTTANPAGRLVHRWQAKGDGHFVQQAVRHSIDEFYHFAMTGSDSQQLQKDIQRISGCHFARMTHVPLCPAFHSRRGACAGPRGKQPRRAQCRPPEASVRIGMLRHRESAENAVHRF